MPLVCPRCHRANPAEAAYCHFDGVVLVPPAGGTLPPGALPEEFVFPSGRRCRTFDDLVQGCQYEWEDARILLKRGEFGPYFARIGRLDLARMAREAHENPDTDIALHQFVGSLPASFTQGPRLDLQPRRLLIGPIPAGREDEVRLTVVNQGKGLLQGKLSVNAGVLWLHTGALDNGNQVSLKTARTQDVTLRVSTRGLVAPQSYSTSLTVVSNGGVVEVPVRLDVAAIPFGREPFRDACSARDLAARMRANPKGAVPLLENGAISAWFALNGWTYPVTGAAATGVAAVQQFFEYMALSKPPPLKVDEPVLAFECAPEVARSSKVTIRTDARKWVYAHAESDVPWLHITTPDVSGPQQATISFEIDPRQLRPGVTHETTLRIVGNAGQPLAVRISAVVRAPRKSRQRSRLRTDGVVIVGLAALFYRLLLAVPSDLYARSAPAGLKDWMKPALIEPGYLRSFVLATSWIGAIVGLLVARRLAGKIPDLVCATIAGAFAGLIGSATLGCLLAVLDTVPRLLFAALNRADPGALLARVMWIGWASACWGVGGLILGGVLSHTGPSGKRILASFVAPVARLLGWLESRSMP
jgi:hypothetical protein